MIVDDNLMYKTIKSPNYIRRNIIGMGIDLIGLMQQQDKIKKIRQQKNKIMGVLVDEVKTTENLLEEFYNLIPKVKKGTPKVSPVVKSIEKKRVKQEQQPTKIDSLHQELFDLKAKLDSL